MTAKSARRLTIIAAALAAAALACAVFAFRGKIAEEYWLWRLEDSDEAWRKLAIRELGERRSVKALRGILELMPKYPGLTSRALVKIGKPAFPLILEALQSPDELHRLELILLLDRIDRHPTCVRALGMPDPPPLPPVE